MGRYDDVHPTHYVRNFFFCVWAILVCAAFSALFVGLAITNLTLIIAGAIVCAIALVSVFKSIISAIIHR